MEKRGQLTLFIIVGLLLLVLLGLLFMFKSKLSFESIIPSKISPVEVYTQDCIESVSERGIFLLGLQGGYINLPDTFKGHPDVYLEVGIDVPMWFYKNKNTFPTLKQMENELSTYVSENLLVCLNHYNEFQAQYYIPEITNVTTTTIIGKNTIQFKVNIPLSIKERGSGSLKALPVFEASIDNRLGERYELAKQLLLYENQVTFLELLTDEMIAASDWLPYEGMEIGCEGKLWRLDQMNDYIRNLIMYNLRFVMVQGTNFKETGMPYYDNIYKIKPFNENHKSISVQTIYNPDWGLKLDVSPRKGQIIKPIDIPMDQVFLSCIKVFHHKYSYSFPVLFEIRDANEPEYPFYFATPVMVTRNMPDRYNEISPWKTDIDFANNDMFCSNVTEYTIYDVDRDNNILFRPAVTNNRKYSLRVYAKDPLLSGDMQFLPGVNISYQCTKFRCSMGSTFYPLNGKGMYVGELASLKTKFPGCENGWLIAERPGYKEAHAQQTVDAQSNNAQVDIEMVRLKDFTYEVQVIENRNGLIDIRPLKNNETALVTIINSEHEYEESLIYPQTDYPVNLSLMVGDFKYELAIRLANADRMIGGAELNFTTTASSILENGHIIFYAYEKTVPYYLPTSEDTYKYYEEAVKNSKNYPPELT